MRKRMMLLGAALVMGSWAGTWAAGPGAGEKKGKDPRGFPPPPAVEDIEDGEESPGPYEGRGPRNEMEGPEEREALEFIREAAPEMQDEFFRARREKPAAFRKKLRRMAPMLKDPETREALKRQIKLEFQVRRMASEMRKADGKEDEAVKKELAKALSEQFDAKLELQVKRLQKMKEDLSQLESRINKRKAQKDEIVKKRLSELSGESEPWDW
ncbi:MAG: hypothetical protein HY748_14480 [Elusimicrobia bacterium]|nr:hypothetical protein [Elusimicrobiota bacterium]